jgi:hypothetical protein
MVEIYNFHICTPVDDHDRDFNAERVAPNVEEKSDERQLRASTFVPPNP